jgi:hypothetical protein
MELSGGERGDEKRRDEERENREPGSAEGFTSSPLLSL